MNNPWLVDEVFYKRGLILNSSLLCYFDENVPSKVWLSLWPQLQKASSVRNDPPSPKFDLEASSFPPLPGCVDCIQGETTQEMRLSDVVRGLKVTTKVEIVSKFLTLEVTKSVFYKYSVYTWFNNTYLFQVSEAPNTKASKGGVKPGSVTPEAQAAPVASTASRWV